MAYVRFDRLLAAGEAHGLKVQVTVVQLSDWQCMHMAHGPCGSNCLQYIICLVHAPLRLQ